MPFQKGGKKMGGRAKGTPNFASIEKRGLIEFIKEEGKDQFLRELATLEGKDYCKIYKDVIEIAFPKLQRTELTGKDGGDLNINMVNYADNNSTS